MSVQIQQKSESSFVIVKTNDKTGKVDDSVELHASKVLEGKAIGQIISAVVKSAGTRRDAWLSFLARVYTMPTLKGYKGTGDRTTGKVSKEFKEAVRNAERMATLELVNAGELKLPKGDAEQVLQEFLSGLRDDKNYSNVKVTANRFFALVGSNVVTPASYLIPVEVMKARIDEVVDKPEEDKSITGMLKAVETKLADVTIDSADAIDALAATKRLLSTLDGICNKYAELATAGRMGVDNAANAAIEKASIGTRTRVPKEQVAPEVEGANS